MSLVELFHALFPPARSLRPLIHAHSFAAGFHKNIAFAVTCTAAATFISMSTCGGLWGGNGLSVVCRQRVADMLPILFRVANFGQ